MERLKKSVEWSETSRNAKKMFPLLKGGEGGSASSEVFAIFQGEKKIRIRLDCDDDEEEKNVSTL